MKKNRCCDGIWPLFYQILRKMKLTLMLLFLTVLTSIAADSYSQSVKLTLKLENTRIEDVLGRIEDQSKFRFFYNEEINLEKRISLSASDESIVNILDEIFRGKGIHYEIVDRQIILTNNVDFKNSTSQQQKSVSGKVTDSSGASLPGVSVVVKDTTNGTITDSNGNYSISGIPENAVLQFSFVGMKTQEVAIGSKTTINITLAEDAIGIEEVVAVGYGTQKKVNLTGSISSIRSEKLNSIPTQTISQAVMGKASGVFIKNVNGQPGDSKGIQYNIRGFGDALIIIDGVPGTSDEMNQIDPSDIEEFNILKDAASGAVYGSRAGNGVILIKTKRGKLSDAVFTYSSNYSLQHFSIKPDFVSSTQYLEMENLAQFNAGLAPIWTNEQIKNYKDGKDRNKYPNTDWWNATLRKFAPQTQHNINIRGGNEKVRYFVSGGYFHQDGMLRSDDIKYDRYNLRSNLDVSLTKRLTVGIDLSFAMQDYIGPRNQLERSDVLGIMTMLRRARSYYPLHPGGDETKLVKMANGLLPTVLSEIDNMGFRKSNNYEGDTKVTLSYDLPFGFKTKAIINFNRTYYKYKEKTAKEPVYTYNNGVYTPAGYTNDPSKLYQKESFLGNLNQQYFLTWDKSITDNNLSALFVYELLSNKSDYIEASRIRYLYDIDYLFAGPTLDSYNNGSATEDGRRSFVSRINYNYKGKYLLELNGRYDGSPRFPSETRWGFFPSASIGWRISEEGFLKDKVSFINNLKVRASYGKMGNDQIGTFQYLSTFSLNGGYIYDGATNVVDKGIKSDILPNTYITWEKMSTLNAGVDFTIFNSLIEGSFDYFYRKRSDVLGSRNASIPDIVGASMPLVNYGKFDNRGWEISLDHKNSINGIKYSIGGNISWNREKCLYIDENEFANVEAKRRGTQVGQWTDAYWGIMTDGLFQSKEEIGNWADIDGKNNATLLPGDVKKVDYNGDGRITDEDKVIIGRGTSPKLTYGINASISWKHFDLNMLWQGAGLYNFDLSNSPDYSKQFYGGNTPLTEWYKNSYTPENPWIPTNTKNARWPLWRSGPQNGNESYQSSEFWLINGAYIRLKTIDLGYSLSENLIKKWGIDNCRFFISGYNVLTFSALNFLDPEVDTSPRRVFGDYYPPVGSYSIGLQIQF